MKKSPIIFIAMLIALAFTSCQMNTDDTGANPVVPTTQTSETEYAITIVASHGTVELDKTKAKVGETVKLTKLEADDGYTFKTMSIKKENGEDVTELDRTNQSFTMPESNVTFTIIFTEATPTNDNGNEDDTQTETPTDNGTGGNTNPPATIEYTVSVADGIKGGHIEVSLDDKTWTKLSAPVKYAKGKKIYVRAVADKHYQYIDGLKADDYEEKVRFITLNDDVELTANFVVKYEPLTPGSLEFNGKFTNLREGYRRLVMIDIKKSDFSEDFKDARLAFGFPDGFYGVKKEIGSTSTDKYFYVYDTVIPYDTFAPAANGNLIRIFVAIYLADDYELPDGKIYVLFPNLKEDGKGTIYTAKMDTSIDTDFQVGVNGANGVNSEKYYFDASQL